MEYPTINVIPKSKQAIDVFLGYNHNLHNGENEFYDMKNMTSDYYPVLATRKKRGLYKEGFLGENLKGQLTGMIAKDGIYFVEGQYFRIDGRLIDMELSTQEADIPKNLISMGSYIIIMPDKKWINTIDKDGEYEWGKIEASWDTSIFNPPDGDVSFKLCTLNDGEYGDPPVDIAAPKDPKDGDLWIDSSSTPHTLKRYSSERSMWISVPTTYIKITGWDIGKHFQKYDGVKISGITVEGASALNGYHIIWEKADDYIIVIGMIDKTVTQHYEDGIISVERKMPKMDHVFECNNRLWGCRYGTNADGDTVNEIYASKLGDFKNWNCYMQISTDSFTQSAGSDGPFTGAISYMGNPIFFKENCMHKVLGSIPANFQLQTTPCRGVQQNSHRSLAIVNETLYYKSANAVCAYDGSLPVEISSPLGDVHYMYAIGGALGNKYYVSMSKTRLGNDEDYSLFVYDTQKRLWHREDNLKAGYFCSYKDEIYAACYEDGYITKIITLRGSGDTYEINVPWMVETGLVGMSMPNMKYISNLLVRMSLEPGASTEISIQYDSVDYWEHVCSIASTSLRSFSIPIRPKRCDHFRIRIEGIGGGKIYSITKTIEQGSDIS